MRTVTHAAGRHADIHGEGRRTVLLWHGSEPEQRDALAPLASGIAAHGLTVVVPDWRSDADDGGRSDLLSSVRLARDTMSHAGADPDTLVVVGWSLGGTAAASLAVHARRLGVALRAVVLLAAAGEAVDPLSGAVLPDPLPPGDAAVHVVLGRDDTVIDPGTSLALAMRLRDAGYATTVTSVGADHGGIAMTRYDAELARYVPSDAADVLMTGESVAELVAAATRGSRRR